MRRSALLFAGTAIFAATGCDAPTQLVVVVDSDYAPGTELRRVEIEIVEVGTSRPPSIQSFDVTAMTAPGAARVEIPFSFGVVTEDPGATVEISATGYGPMDQPLVRRLARTGFLDGERLRLALFLARACEDVYLECERMEQTCLAGTCVAVDIPVAELIPVEPGRELLDAGRSETGAGDATAPSDAAMCVPDMGCEPRYLPCYTGRQVCSPSASCEPDTPTTGACSPAGGTCTNLGGSTVCAYTMPAADPIPGALAGNRIGESVAIAGDWAAVGTPGANGVLVFSFSAGSWNMEAKLEPPVATGMFARDVALSDRWLAVGAPNTDEGVLGRAGAVFVYELVSNTWMYRQELKAPSPIDDGFFGVAVAVEGDRLVTSEWGADQVHVFEFDGARFVHDRALTAADDVGSGAPLGHWLDLSGDDLAVSRVQPGVASSSGQVHVFDLLDPVGSAQTILPAAYAMESGNGFGKGVTFDSDGDLIVVRGFGTVHEYENLGVWTEVAETPLGGTGWNAAAASDGRVIVGDPNAFDLADLLIRTEDSALPMIRSYRLTDPSGGGTADARFGFDVAISTRWVVIGAPLQQIDGETTGAVYFFDLDAI